MQLRDYIFSAINGHLSAEGDQQRRALSLRGEPHHHQGNAKRCSAGLSQESSKTLFKKIQFSILSNHTNMLLSLISVSLHTGPAEPKIQGA